MSEVKNNIKFWKSLVGLPRHFPELYPLKGRDIIELMVINEDEKSSIQKSMDTNMLTQVVLSEGGGLTTLYNYLLQDAVDTALERLIIPVKMDFEEFDREISQETIEQEIKKQIIYILIENPWESRLNSVYYYNCINFEEGEGDLDAYKSKMRHFLFADKAPSYKSICAQFPWLKDELQDIINYLLKNFRIQTILFYHFPRKMDEQKMLDLTSALKMIYEHNSFDQAAIRELYLCTPAIQRDLDREYKRPFDVIKYPVYTSAQIYTMLVKRYTPYVPGSKGRNMINLSAVFSENFIRDSWTEKLGLKDIIKKVKEKMEQRLTCHEKEVAFRLEPAGINNGKDDTEVSNQPELKPEVAEEAKEAEKPRRRFQRKR